MQDGRYKVGKLLWVTLRVLPFVPFCSTLDGAIVTQKFIANTS